MRESDELVGALADEPAAFEVRDRPLEELRIAQELERGLLLFGRELGLRLARRLAEALLLDVLEREQELAQIALDQLLAKAQLLGGLLDVGRPLPGAIEVERVDEIARIGLALGAAWP